MPRAIAKRPAPLSIRLTEAERSLLLERAGTLGLSTYVKHVVFKGDASALRSLPRRASADFVVLGRILSQLGKLQIASDLAALAHAAKAGLVQMDADTDRQLREACDLVRDIRALLMAGLGKAENCAPRLADEFAEAAQSVSE